MNLLKCFSRPTSPHIVVPLAVLVLLLLCPTGVPRAQEEDDVEPEEEGISGKVYAEVAAWIAQASGQGFVAASQVSTSNPFNSSLLAPSHGTENEFRYRLGYRLSQNVGTVVGTWYAHGEEVERTDSTPGVFGFGTILAPQLFAGFANDGLADGYDFQGRTLLRDLRLDFYREAFRTRRVWGDWFVGYRRVKYFSEARAAYTALVPGLPPLLPPFSPPRPDLTPLPDSGVLLSDFRGRGLEAGMDVFLPIWRDRIKLEGGFLVGTLRGKTSTVYQGSTHFYERDGEVVQAPYDDDFDTSGEVDRTSQESLAFRQTSSSLSTSGQVLEVHLGARGRVWRDLEVFVGFRTAHYTDVGTQLRPRSLVTEGGLNAQDAERTPVSPTYEGFYLGFSAAF